MHNLQNHTGHQRVLWCWAADSCNEWADGTDADARVHPVKVIEQVYWGENRSIVHIKLKEVSYAGQAIRAEAIKPWQ